MKRRSKRSRGGAPMPLAYFGAASQIGMPVAEGKDMLLSSGSIIRPRIGGAHTLHAVRTRKQSKTRSKKQRGKQSKKQRGKQSKKQRGKQSGGFIPTIMEGFCMAASKYITPIALFAGYKFMTRKQR